MESFWLASRKIVICRFVMVEGPACCDAADTGKMAGEARPRAAADDEDGLAAAGGESVRLVGDAGCLEERATGWPGIASYHLSQNSNR